MGSLLLACQSICFLLVRHLLFLSLPQPRPPHFINDLAFIVLRCLCAKSSRNSSSFKDSLCFCSSFVFTHVFFPRLSLFIFPFLPESVSGSPSSCLNVYFPLVSTISIPQVISCDLLMVPRYSLVNASCMLSSFSF